MASNCRAAFSGTRSLVDYDDLPLTPCLGNQIDKADAFEWVQALGVDANNLHHWLVALERKKLFICAASIPGNVLVQ